MRKLTHSLIHALLALFLYAPLSAFTQPAAPASPGGVVSPSESDADPEATLFIQSCLRCHPGSLTGAELSNTHSRPVQNLDAAVRRMQKFTGTFTEEQITQLVSLLKDQSFISRVQEAKLEMLDTDFAEKAPVANAPPADPMARLYVTSCASCHTIGSGGKLGGDLARTAAYPLAQLQNAVKRMEPRVGPLTPEQVTGLSELLKDTNVKKRLADAGLKVDAPHPATGNPAPAGAFQSMQTDGPQPWLIQSQAVPLRIIIPVLLGLLGILLYLSYYVQKKGK